MLHSQYTKDFKKAMAYLQAFVDSKTGQISPTHEVYAMMEKVQQLQAAEEEKKRLEAEKKRLEEERQKRNEQLLTNMATIITETQGKLAQYGECLDPGSVEEVTMILEQAQMVVEAKEVDMAQDIQQLLDAYVPALDEAISGCAGGAPPPAPAPAEEGGEEAAPTEGGSEEPAPE
jgi:hypothetical protein